MMKSTLTLAAQRSWIAAAVLAFGGIISSSHAADSDPKSLIHTEKLLATPHFYQEDPRAQFPGDGNNYCCPTAVSDSLVYLAAHGFPKLLPRGIADPTDGQIALIKKLAAPDCMNTNPATGTDAGQACAGIKRYVEGSGYVCKSIEYRGWRPMPKALAFYTTGSLPPLDWIKQTAADPHAAVWLNIGWYVKTENANEWKRTGGHWVAVTGYGVDATGHANPTILLIDNPAVLPASAPSVADNIMTTTLTEQGRLIGSYQGLPRNAESMYRVAGPGIHLSKKFDAAFLDGAIILVIADHKP